MRGFIIAALLVGGLSAGGVAAYLYVSRSCCTLPARTDGEFTSGPQVGTKLPSTFEPFNINGADAGSESCLCCKAGNNPVVIVFASKPSDALASLASRLDKVIAESKSEKVSAFVVVTDTSETAKAELKRLAEREKLKDVVLSVIDPAELQKYGLNPEAELTVLMSIKQVVRENRAFRSGELTPVAIAEVAERAGEHYASK